MKKPERLLIALLLAATVSLSLYNCSRQSMTDTNRSSASAQAEESGAAGTETAAAQAAPAAETAEDALHAPAETAAAEAQVEETAAQEEAPAFEIIENGGMMLSVPAEYKDLLVIETPDDPESGTLFSVSEKASLDAAARTGDNPDGAGWLFGIDRIDEAALREKLCYDMSGEEIFAKDASGSHYVFTHPTDVRFVRESYTDIAEDMKEWSELNEWAWSSVRSSFLADNAELEEESYGNTSLDMYFARIAYQEDTDYTLSTTEFGPLGPGSVDPAPYLERLTDGVVFEETEAEAPDGEYVVLDFPEDGVRFDFFTAEDGKNLIREVWSEDMERFYLAGYEDGTIQAADIMDEWYQELARAAGKYILSSSGEKILLSEDASGFVLLSEAVPDAILEMRYYSTMNFVGDRIDGYEEPLAFLTWEAAAALREVSDELAEQGYRLKIYDAYRPQRAVNHFLNWSLDIGDTRMKPYFYPDLDKDVLFKQGYIAELSSHSRGSTVDLTLFDMEKQQDVDMGGSFDFFGESSHPHYTGITTRQYANRMILREAMITHGFRPLPEEWWHFTLAEEPYPDTYFNFPINSDALLQGEAEPVVPAQITSIYAAPASQVITDGDGGKELADTLIYLYDDSSYSQYVVRDEELTLYTEGLYETDAYPAPDEPEIMTVIVQKQYAADGECTEVNGYRYGVNLSGKEEYRLVPVPDEEDESPVTAVFMQAYKQKLVREDGSADYLTTVWVYYEDGRFHQYALLDGETVLFSTGDYSLSTESFDDPDWVLTLHRDRKYKDGEGLTEYDSTHDYQKGELGFIRVYPE